MTTFEIITLAKELSLISNRDITRADFYFDGNKFKLDVIAEEDKYWSVYMDEYHQEEGEWSSTYICTKSVFSMEGAIADAIDQVIEFLNKQ
jgi:hypothetical protein